MASEDELTEARRQKAEALREHAITPFPNDFRADEVTERKRKELLALAADEVRRAALPTEDELTEDADVYPLYGRVIARRGPFIVLRTPYGDAQGLVRKELLGAADAATLDNVDLADHVYLEGPAIRTKTGALALRAAKFRHLGKALLPPPAKWHGLTDVEKRYRERYVDL
ncbi:MAG: lysine--tRNA ligase, partial [Polyangiaceae bacterium]|nr:lysine--tRNA ligase [Polyangiaceae bacterium]